MNTRRWLLVIYTIPTTPSRTRAYVWREIRRAGALLLRDGVAVLPMGSDTERWARETSRRIEAAGGTVTTAVAALAAGDERRVTAAFQAEREREYGEIVASCRALVAHVEREREHAEFTFDELEELEADLEKIRRWRDMVRARDRFGAPSGKRATRAIADCARRIAAFGERASSGELPRLPRRTPKRRATVK